ncbi:MAG: histidine phosphatase family protein [Rhodovulum sulfidophilum]|uniref:Histidine phosphatase family protein n=1 Tax=Rhodovulum sulfidophilum TaxID=35806 RepID=A0A2W5N0B5_RHOSU|nr:MAG: histidine phosphatase family protein [Rhodovulum sulfidophilum]
MIRLTLLCHGATEATRAAAFPRDEPLEPRALAATRALRGTLSPARVRVSPALRTRQTAEALGFDGATVDPALRDRDPGGWAGASLARLIARDPAAIEAFLTDPRARPGGDGDSTAGLVARLGDWLGRLPPEPGQTLAITHADVMRALVIHVLGAPLAAFGRVDVPPLTTLELVSDGRRWLWRAARAS